MFDVLCKFVLMSVINCFTGGCKFQYKRYVGDMDIHKCHDKCDVLRQRYKMLGGTDSCRVHISEIECMALLFLDAEATGSILPLKRHNAFITAQ